ncbi:MAG TPA: archaellin/type IV pilin N-terminal domain-containing protein [archaeon]|nr:archaellin/type IV pilin N-terminal domain-containing protein [archaeon]
MPQNSSYGMRRKGISPLIAAVLLIAFTMSIAGLMAAWATSFTQTRLDNLDCVNAIEISQISFTDENVTARIRNIDSTISIQNLTISVLFSDANASSNREAIPVTLPYDNTDNNGHRTKVELAAPNPLVPGVATTVKINLFAIGKPAKIEVNSMNCKQPTARNF